MFVFPLHHLVYFTVCVVVVIILLLYYCVIIPAALKLWITGGQYQMKPNMAHLAFSSSLLKIVVRGSTQKVRGLNFFLFYPSFENYSHVEWQKEVQYPVIYFSYGPLPLKCKNETLAPFVNFLLSNLDQEFCRGHETLQQRGEYNSVVYDKYIFCYWIHFNFRIYYIKDLLDIHQRNNANTSQCNRIHINYIYFPILFGGYFNISNVDQYCKCAPTCNTINKVSGINNLNVAQVSTILKSNHIPNIWHNYMIPGIRLWALCAHFHLGKRDGFHVWVLISKQICRQSLSVVISGHISESVIPIFPLSFEFPVITELITCYLPQRLDRKPTWKCFICNSDHSIMSQEHFQYCDGVAIHWHLWSKYFETLWSVSDRCLKWSVTPLGSKITFCLHRCSSAIASGSSRWFTFELASF